MSAIHSLLPMHSDAADRKSSVHIELLAKGISWVEIRSSVSGIFVSGIESRQEGGGRFALAQLCAISDLHAIILTLRCRPCPGPLGDPPKLDIHALRAWYERHSFVVERGDELQGYVMQRDPFPFAIE